MKVLIVIGILLAAWLATPPQVLQDPDPTTRVEQCKGEALKSLTNADRAEIIRLMLDEAITQKKIPSYPQLTAGKQIILSTENLNQGESPRLPGVQLLLLSPAQIQDRANHEGDLMYLSFEKIEPRGSCVAVTLYNEWADGTSTIETGPKTFLGEGAIQYVFTKRNGAWKGEFITGWIS